MKKHCKFIFDEDKERADAQLKECENAISINDVEPFVAGVGRVACITANDIALNGVYIFDVMFEEDRPSDTVIIENGMNYLPERLRGMVQQNGWFCVSLKRINSNNDLEQTLAIYYEPMAFIRFGLDLDLLGIYSSIYLCSGRDTYMCHFNHHHLVIGNDDDYSCCVIGSGDTETIEYNDSRCINWLCQILRNYYLR